MPTSIWSIPSPIIFGGTAGHVYAKDMNCSERFQAPTTGTLRIAYAVPGTVIGAWYTIIEDSQSFESSIGSRIVLRYLDIYPDPNNPRQVILEAGARPNHDGAVHLRLYAFINTD